MVDPRAWFVATLVALAMPAGAMAQADDRARESANREVVRSAFDAWAAGGTQFFDILADDVVWTIAGSGPSAKTYRGKAMFLKNEVTPFSTRLSVPLRPSVRAIYTDGDEVIILWDGTATARDGQGYRNSYAWFFTMKDSRVATARAFLDLPAYDALLRRVRPAPRR